MADSGCRSSGREPLAVDRRWEGVAEEYARRWPDLNAPLIDRALASLPAEDLPQGWVHLAGAGPGAELERVAARWPDRRILASDVAAAMLALLRRHHPTLPLVQEDMVRPSVRRVALSLSFFVVHLVHDSVQALAGQARCLRPGGLLAALYFPATPVGGGPLAALHRASRLLAPRPDSPWERRAFEEIEAFTGAPVETLEVSASWRFPTLQRAQETLELLPHLGSIRERAGEGFYQHLWRTWREDPGLAPSEGGGLAGPVTARLAVAHRPSRP